MDWPSGRTAFVTGGASGIGLGIAKALARAGANVALVDRDIGKAREEASRIATDAAKVFAIELDISDDEAWAGAADQAEEALGPVSLLFNNAGVGGSDGHPADIAPTVWRWVFSVNTHAQFYGVRTFLPRFEKRGGKAHIVNTASMAGLVPMAESPIYSASKFASVGLSLSLREKFQGSDIGVSVLCPGTINTSLPRTAAKALSLVTGKDETLSLEDAEAWLAHGANPDDLGIIVLDAIRRRQFFILTHSDWAPLTQSIHDEISGTFRGIEKDLGPDLLARAIIAGKESAVSAR